MRNRDNFELRVFDRIGHQAEVNDIAQHVVINLVGPAVFDVDVDGRIVLHEFFDIRRQVVQADAVNRRDPDCARNDVLELLQLAIQRFIRLDDLLAVIVKHLAFAREAESFLAALDQQRLEDAFQGGDLLADGGLRDAVDLGGFGETFGFCQITKHFQTLNLHRLSIN